MKALKDLPIRVQTANFKDRNKIIQDVISVLSNSGKKKLNYIYLCL